MRGAGAAEAATAGRLAARSRAKAAGAAYRTPRALSRPNPGQNEATLPTLAAKWRLGQVLGAEAAEAEDRVQLDRVRRSRSGWAGCACRRRSVWRELGGVELVQPLPFLALVGAAVERYPGCVVVEMELPERVEEAGLPDELPVSRGTRDARQAGE
jgi:hypothetical protein